MKNIAILLTCHNRKAKTLACLEALFQNNLPEGYAFEVFLVDDGSTDGTGEAVRINYPKVNVIQGAGNLYWNRGMRLAWETAAKAKEYNHYIWLNDDTILSENALVILLKSASEYNNNCIIVGSTVDDNGSYSYGGYTNSKIIEPKSDFQECEYFNGNIVIIPYNCFKVVGYNDSVFQHALGDFDYALRCKKFGIKSYIAPAVLGQCNKHISLPIWCNPKYSFSQRWEYFRTPLGHNPEEFFIFEFRHGGFLIAVFHYFTNHVRVLFPQFWKI